MILRTTSLRCSNINNFGQNIADYFVSSKAIKKAAPSSLDKPTKSHEEKNADGTPIEFPMARFLQKMNEKQNRKNHLPR